MQAAFVKHDGYQCGYCTPGQICSAVAVLGEIKAGIPSHVTADLTAQPQATPEEMRERMSGNICRCGAYSNIVEAITEVALEERMRTFTYERANSPAEAAAAAARTPGAKFIAGGTNLLDLMKLEIETPEHLIDVNGLALDKIEATPEGGLRIGALVRNTDLAADPRVRRDYGVLSRALLAGASGQLRNKATTGRQPAAADPLPLFLRHQPALQQAQCPAAAARRSAVSAAGMRSSACSDACIATHPSDMAVAMRALDATVETMRPDGATRTIPIADFHRLPGDTPQVETALAAGELITAVTLPKPVGGTQIYHKVRDRASYAFALVSVAAIVQRDGTGRVAVGGVAHKPWRVEAAEGQMPRGAKAVTAQLLMGAQARLPRMHSRCRWSSARSPRCWRKRRVTRMKFDTPASTNPIDQLKVIGQPTDRIDGPLKTTGTAPYAYEWHDVAPNPAYGYVIGVGHRQGPHRFAWI